MQNQTIEQEFLLNEEDGELYPVGQRGVASSGVILPDFDLTGLDDSENSSGSSSSSELFLSISEVSQKHKTTNHVVVRESTAKPNQVIIIDSSNTPRPTPAGSGLDPPNSDSGR